MWWSRTQAKNSRYLRLLEAQLWWNPHGAKFSFLPIPDAAITQAHWIEGGEPGNVDRRSVSDRHLLIVDRDNRHLYELYNVYYNGTQWVAGSGAFFNLNTNDRRPEGWTSADAAGLAILPGLVRYTRVRTARFRRVRVTVRDSNGMSILESQTVLVRLPRVTDGRAPPV